MEIIAIRLRANRFAAFSMRTRPTARTGTKPRPKESVEESRHTLACAEDGVKLAHDDTVNRKMTGGRLIAPDRAEIGASRNGSVEITSG